jgi:hypothetical protein
MSSHSSLESTIMVTIYDTSLLRRISKILWQSAPTVLNRAYNSTANEIFTIASNFGTLRSVSYGRRMFSEYPQQSSGSGCLCSCIQKLNDTCSKFTIHTSSTNPYLSFIITKLCSYGTGAAIVATATKTTAINKRESSRHWSAILLTSKSELTVVWIRVNVRGRLSVKRICCLLRSLAYYWGTGGTFLTLILSPTPLAHKRPSTAHLITTTTNRICLLDWTIKINT